MQIEEITKNKNVLMIPVYSTRNYETGTYYLLSDGNISKFLMKILKSEANKILLTHFWPEYKKEDYVSKIYDDNSIILAKTGDIIDI